MSPAGAGHGDHPDPWPGLRGGLPAGTQGQRGPPGGAACTSGFVAAHVTVVHEVLRTSSGHGTKMRTVPPRRGRLPCPHPRVWARTNPPDCRFTSSSVPIGLRGVAELVSADREQCPGKRLEEATPHDGALRPRRLSSRVLLPRHVAALCRCTPRSHFAYAFPPFEAVPPGTTL